MRTTLLDVPIDALDMRELTDAVNEAVRRRTTRTIAHQNLHSLYLMRKDDALAEFLRSADVVHADGMALVLLSRLEGGDLRREHRTTYVDWLDPLLRRGEAEGWRVIFVGSAPGVDARAIAVLSDRHPGISFACHHGYFEEGGPEEAALLAEIRRFDPDVLMVGMGMPRQERWIARHRDALAVPAVLPVGGCMDYVAGEIPTPPRWAARLGFEWLSRLVSEPRRLWRRYLVEPLLLLPWLVPTLVRSRWSRRRRARGSSRRPRSSDG
jgi:N-acetylglucosaminyldiphosphoundecaprenol N-acetyl-beta-D-mannosaminyltransferase